MRYVANDSTILFLSTYFISFENDFFGTTFWYHISPCKLGKAFKNFSNLVCDRLELEEKLIW